MRSSSENAAARKGVSGLEESQDGNDARPQRTWDVTRFLVEAVGPIIFSTVVRKGVAMEQDRQQSKARLRGAGRNEARDHIRSRRFRVAKTIRSPPITYRELNDAVAVDILMWRIVGSTCQGGRPRWQDAKLPRRVGVHVVLASTARHGAVKYSKNKEQDQKTTSDRMLTLCRVVPHEDLRKAASRHQPETDDEG